MLTSAIRRDTAACESRAPEPIAPPDSCAKSAAEALSEHTPALVARALFLARNHADAWDLVQDTLERALRRRPPFPQHDLRRWLFVVMHHLGREESLYRLRDARARLGDA